jgi:cysteine-rich repeat protein
MVDECEECDDGNVDNTDACTNSCKSPVCGDGLVQAGVEQCDDANGTDEDDCTNACTAAACGDSIVQPGVEACDDGNMIDDDACTSQCTVPGCGDGVTTPPEQCDDANADNTDACTAMCLNAVCGDGIVQAGVDECDDGNAIDGDGCQADCTIPQKFTALGPQINFPEASLTGWTVCFSQTYDLFSPTVAEAFAGCTKANLMLACRPVGSPNFTLLAHAPRESVLADTGTSNEPTVANGVGWYYSDSYSLGFANQGDPIVRNSCDTEGTNPGLRLCWHSDAGLMNGGYRCGEAIGLNSDPAWERVILHAD